MSAQFTMVSMWHNCAFSLCGSVSGMTKTKVTVQQLVLCCRQVCIITSTWLACSNAVEAVAFGASSWLATQGLCIFLVRSLGAVLAPLRRGIYWQRDGLSHVNPPSLSLGANVQRTSVCRIHVTGVQYAEGTKHCIGCSGQGWSLGGWVRLDK